MNNLKRFVEAQEYCYDIALSEIKAGYKESHWMWFIFPQIRGLGISDLATYYGISDVGEAKLYLEHEVLGPRLVEATKELLLLDKNDAEEIFGEVDALKLRSSMTLFDYVSADENIFSDVIDKFYDGAKDEKTIQLIKSKS